MRIRMTTISAGPNGILDAEQVVDLPDAKGRELVETLHAVAVEPDVRATAKWPHSVDPSFPQAEPQAEKKSK